MGSLQQARQTCTRACLGWLPILLLGLCLQSAPGCEVIQPGAPAQPSDNPPLPPGPEPPPPPGGIVTVVPALDPLQGEGASNADDPAIWIHPTQPERSLLFLSDKDQGIFVFDLQGNQLQHVDFGTSLNNIDVRTKVQLGTETMDLVAGNLRGAGKLAILRIDGDAGRLTVLSDQNSTGNDISSDSYGFTLYRRPIDGALFVFDKSKSSAPIRQWRVSAEGSAVQTVLVREIDDVAMGVAEGFVADDELGYVYFAEETYGVHKYHADPEDPIQTRLAVFAMDDGSESDREGLALYARPDGTGWLVLSSQGNSTFMVYERQGTNALRRVFRAEGATGSDGLDVTAAAVPGFPLGFAVIHDDPGSRYLVYDWADILGEALQFPAP